MMLTTPLNQPVFSMWITFFYPCGQITFPASVEFATDVGLVDKVSDFRTDRKKSFGRSR
jgi:hypothetical protein